MATLSDTQPGIFTLNQFVDRQPLRLAPDCFVSFNGAAGFRIGTSNNSSSKEALDLRSGVTSVSVQSTVNGPGNGTCSVNISAPQYSTKGESSYYVTNPDGTKSLFFQPMMEVRVYMKGRFMSSINPYRSENTDVKDVSIANDTGTSPRYYQVFWGFITDISENFSGSMATITLNCKDMLHWWVWQKQIVTASPNPLQTKFNAIGISSAGFGMTIFKDLNPWEIIYRLFFDTEFDKFVLPKFNGGGTAYPLEFDKIISPQSFNDLTRNALRYWQDKFGMGTAKTLADEKNYGLANLEMFGLIGLLDLRNTGGKARNPLESDSKTKIAKTTIEVGPSDDPYMRLSDTYMTKAGLSLDFNILAKVQPFVNFEKNAVGEEPNYMSKLEIAQKVAGDINFEFYMDLNGAFVFKPPFYNMDTKSSKVYRINASDILNISENQNTDNIVNYLEVSGPTIQTSSVVSKRAFHIDFNSIAKYGIRHNDITLAYGSTTEQLQALAVGQMAMINAKVTTASLEIPLRPEMRMGYPVYIDHMDCFYYVTGISHNFTFGSTATTSLTLEAKRTRVRDANGDVMRAFIYKKRTKEIEASTPAAAAITSGSSASNASSGGAAASASQSNTEPGGVVKLTEDEAQRAYEEIKLHVESFLQDRTFSADTYKKSIIESLRSGKPATELLAEISRASGLFEMNIKALVRIVDASRAKHSQATEASKAPVAAPPAPTPATSNSVVDSPAPNQLAVSVRKLRGGPSSSSVQQTSAYDSGVESDRYGNPGTNKDLEANPASRSESSVEKFYREANLYKGVSPGAYTIQVAQSAAKYLPEPGNGVITFSRINKDNIAVAVDNELVQYTDDSVPYTDINGFQHIGAFPYGANLRMIEDTTKGNAPVLEDISAVNLFSESLAVNEVLGIKPAQQSSRTNPLDAQPNSAQSVEPNVDVSQAKTPPVKSSDVMDDGTVPREDKNKPSLNVQDPAGIIGASGRNN